MRMTFKRLKGGSLSIINIWAGKDLYNYEVVKISKKKKKKADVLTIPMYRTNKSQAATSRNCTAIHSFKFESPQPQHFWHFFCQ